MQPLIFLYLYTHGTGHYALGHATPENILIAKNGGGRPVVNGLGNMNKYVNALLQSADGRFAQSSAWVSFMLGLIEKLNIRNTNCHVILSSRAWTREQVANITASDYNHNIVSFVPHTI